MLSRELGEYADALYSADSLDSAFKTLEKQALRLGFDGVLYTYIPGLLIDSDISAEPLFQVTEDYSPQYLSHYQSARFDRFDPLISAVSEGTKQKINWSGDICESYMLRDKKSREVIDVARQYGIKNGVTIPLLSGTQGIAGASFINRDKGGFSILLQERADELHAVASAYHNLVMANTGYLGNFIKPVFASLNDLEIRLLAGLASGECPASMATKLCRSEKYLEQVMLKMRRKVSGVGPFDKPTINRNQLLYYAGLVNIINYAESL